MFVTVIKFLKNHRKTVKTLISSNEGLEICLAKMVPGGIALNNGLETDFFWSWSRLGLVSVFSWSRSYAGSVSFDLKMVSTRSRVF